MAIRPDGIDFIIVASANWRGSGAASLERKSVAKKTPFLNGSVCKATRHRRLKSQDLIEVIGVLMLL